MAGKLASKRALSSAEVQSGFTPRVIAVTLIVLFVFLGWMFYWMLYAEQQALLEARRTGLAEEVQLAISVCRRYYLRVESGEYSRDEAMDQARSTLLDLRYGQLSEGYFYIVDRRGTMVGHPFRPDLTGQDLLSLTDKTGVAFVNKLIGGSLQGPGRYETYQYNWLDSATEVPEQLAYAAGFEPWDWFIVTEVQIADINAQIVGDLSRQVALLLMLTVVLAGVLSATLRRLVLQGVDRLIKVAHALAAGNMSARAVVSPTDEISSLAKAINQMAEGIQARDERLRLTQRAAVYALAKLAEARDRETGGHLLRVREYATALALELSKHVGWREIIDNGFITDLYDASLLHDVGKVAVPDSILLKPDVLDEGEMAIMMSHTLVGANTIRAARERMKAESSFLVMAEQIARSHHERWNGEGYVEGLAGTAIPPAARIFSVADVYDALTTQRPYKRAYTHQQAVGLMREDRGKRFDPEVFDAFLAVADRFDEIRAEFAD